MLIDAARGVIYDHHMFIVQAMVTIGKQFYSDRSGNTKGGCIIVPLASCLTGLESAVGQLTILVFIFKTD